jgi:putative nucleotidyltransferase with HDIG domain
MSTVPTGIPLVDDTPSTAAELSPQARQALLDFVRALVRTVEAKDAYTRRHSEQVAHYAVNLARVLVLPETTVESIRVASLLHDIGKIGVPDRVLTKSGRLTDEEFEHIRRHPALGAEILANIPLFRREAQLVRHHHERWDGRGYPDGLAGQESPLASRIIQVADCIDAMLMERTYKKGYPVADMLGELIRCSGTQFDPQVAAAALQWCRSNPDKLILPNGNAVPEAARARAG